VLFTHRLEHVFKFKAMQQVVTVMVNALSPAPFRAHVAACLVRSAPLRDTQRDPSRACLRGWEDLLVVWSSPLLRPRAHTCFARAEFLRSHQPTRRGALPSLSSLVTVAMVHSHSGPTAQGRCSHIRSVKAKLHPEHPALTRPPSGTHQPSPGHSSPGQPPGPAPPHPGPRPHPARGPAGQNEQSPTRKHFCQPSAVQWYAPADTHLAGLAPTRNVTQGR
jgi:hypothetical protein